MYGGEPISILFRNEGVAIPGRCSVMGGRLRGGALLVVVALLSSLIFAPAALAQVETVGSFLVKLARAAGFDIPVPADALRTLVERGIISRPLGNVLSRYLESELTRGLMARTLVDVMRLDAQLVRASTQEMVNFLAQRGIMTAGPAGSLVTAEEVAAILANPTVAAAISAALVPVVVAPVVLAPVAPLVIAVAAAAAAAGAAFAPASP
jgi:hypothetical protein